MSSPPRYRCFGFILYPLEDEKHAFLLKWVIDNERCVFINHNRDVYTEDVFDNDTVVHCKGELKKEHTHLLIYFSEPKTLESIQKVYNKFVSYIEPISSVFAQIRYFTHTDLESVYSGKTLYRIDELNGDTDLISKAFGIKKDCHSVMREMFTFAAKNKMSFARLAQYVVSVDCPIEWRDYFFKHQYVFKCVCNEFSQFN